MEKTTYLKDRKTAEYINRLLESDILIRLEGDQLRVSLPEEDNTAEIEDELIARKEELRAYLRDKERFEKQNQYPKALVPRPANLPLSFSQERFWFLQKLDDEQPSYVIAEIERLTGPLDIPVLEQSLQEIVRRHETLRTIYLVQDDKLVQVIQEDVDFTLDLVDLTDLPLQEREDRAKDLVRRHNNRPFDLTQDLMLRVQLLKLQEEEHILAVTMHHISSDGWSIGIFWRELITLYASFVKGETSPLPELSIQYADYAVWQRTWLKGERLNDQLAYWREQLSGLATQDIPTDRSRPPIQTYRGEDFWFRIPAELQAQLRALSRREGATLFMTLLAAYSLFLNRYSRLEDIAVGTVVANRVRPQIENLIGLFINTLVMRIDLNGNPTFLELLKRARGVALDGYDHQDIPFEKLLEELHPDRDISRTPFFQTMLILQNMPDMPDEELLLGELTVENEAIERRTSALDLSLYMYESQDGLYGRFEFNTDLFDRSTIERMAGHFETLLVSIVADPAQAIGSVPILTPEEETQLDRWNQTEDDFGEQPDIVSQFFRQASRRPKNTAFTFEDQQLTYGELNERSNQLAHYLVGKGIRPGMRVGLALKRSLEVPIALLAIFKAAGVYVPLDLSYPQERLRYIIKDSEIDSLLTTTEWKRDLALDGEGQAGEMQVICLDTLELENESIQDLDSQVKADDIAYIIYTSGSTGQPKGVKVPHRQILNRLAWMWEAYPIQEGEVGSQKTALSFVDSLWELLGYLLQGAPAVIIPDEMIRDPNLLVETLAREKVTRLWLVPSLLKVILKTQDNLQQQLPYLNFWVCSGEELPADLARQFEELMPNAVLYNLYGTSEVWDVTWYDPGQEEAPIFRSTIPIGRPISNMRTYILDGKRNPVPVGVPGELYVGGVGLGRGYIKQPELTDENFMPDPFVQNGHGPIDLLDGEPRMYSTGDLACWLPDGNIEFLGRVDRQIKIRGIRVEPGEIETLLRKHGAVKDAAVIAYGVDEGNQLVAYVTGTGDHEELPAALRSYLTNWLPPYMMPWRIELIEDFPLTPSGKVDRKALAEIVLDPLDLAKEYVAPRTETEEILAEIWADVLEIDHVGINNDFFDLGGHSILGILLFARVEERLGRRLPISILFQAPTIAQLGAVLEQPEESEERNLLVPIQSNGSKPPFFCIHGFGGSVLGYVDLADQLGAEQPFYGIEALGLDGNTEPDESIEAMASRNIKTMRTMQPTGPYRIGGYCLGGVVAFEMARQLEAQGETVALVGIMEGFAPVQLDRDLPLVHPRRLLAMWKSIPFWLQDYGHYGIDRIRRTVRVKINEMRNRILRRESEEAVAAIINADLDELAPHQRQIMITHMQALYHYKGGSFDGEVILFRVKHQSVNRTVFGAMDLDYGWGQLARGGVDVRYVDGAHQNINLMPYAPSLASELVDCLEATSAGE